MRVFKNFSLGSRHFEAESRPCSSTRLTPLEHVSILWFISFLKVYVLFILTVNGFYRAACNADAV